MGVEGWELLEQTLQVGKRVFLTMVMGKALLIVLYGLFPQIN
jgi:hypothetical protein